MIDYLGYLALGTAAGAIIASMALGLVITQQGSNMVNFSLGAMMTWTAHVYAELRQGRYLLPFPGLPDRYDIGSDPGFVLSVIVALLTTAALAWVVYRLVFRPLFRAPSLSTIVAHIGIIVVLSALVERRFSNAAGLRVGGILPNEPVRVISDITVPRDGLWLALIVVGLGGVVWAVMRYSRIGLLTRAAVTSEKGVILLGYNPVRLAEGSYIVAVVLSGFLAILASPMLQLESTTFTFAFLIPALGAVLVAQFRNIPLAIGVAFAIGMLQSSITKFQVDYSWFPRFGAKEGLPFLVIIVAVWLLGDRLPRRGSVETWRLPSVPAAKLTPLSVGAPIVLASAGFLFLGPLWRAALLTTVIATVFALSFVVVTGLGGQTTLAQMAIAGIAGFALSRLATNLDIPFPFAPLLAASAATLAGVLVGFPALRVRGTNLAIVTLGGSVAITEFVFKNPEIIGDAASGGARVPNPELFDWDFGLVLGTNSSRPVFGLFLVAVAALLGIGVANLRRSGTGRRLLALRTNERAAMAAGIDVSRAKLQAYGISSFIAGIGGCLIAYRFGRVSDASFGTFASLTALAVAYLGGITTVSGAVTAGIVAASGVAFFTITEVVGHLGPWETLIGGVLLILTAVLNPQGIAGGIRAEVAQKRLIKAAKQESDLAERSAAAAPVEGDVATPTSAG
ncbi:MAG: ABC transporter permease [Actinomycetota bacterium]